MNDSNSISMRRVVVVGGSSGIGRAIAARFAADGAQVVATGASPAETAAAQALHVEGALSFSVLDVRDSIAVEEFFARQESLDVLVNCAGVIRRGVEHDPSVFAEVVDINLNGTMRCCTAARSLLAQARGTIVNTASMLSFFGGGLVPAYSSSKGGVAQLTKSLAIAYAVDGIRVNAVAPGWIATPLTAALQADPARSGPIVARTPLARWGTPDDVADPVFFLASTAARFITGVILPVDGGYLIS
jgi:NAD(P)-dependent dehydrogenase (short-subunit alcohol dehydrogenase family)